MKPAHSMSIAVALTFVSLAGPVRAEDSEKKDPARSEVSVYGGISILDAHSSQQTTITFPGFPGFPGGPAWSASDILLNTETKLGNSALVGARYAFYLRKQLAIEADFSVAPSADLESSVEVCGSSRCSGGEGYESAGRVQGYDKAMAGLFGGPMGRRFRGMEGMPAGEGPYRLGGGSVTAWHYGGGMVYDILGGDVRPFVTLGAGGVSYDGASGAKTDFTLRFGAGLKVYFGRLGARVDAVDTLILDNSLSGREEHDVHLTGGVFVRF